MRDGAGKSSRCAGIRPVSVRLRTVPTARSSRRVACSPITLFGSGTRKPGAVGRAQRTRERSTVPGLQPRRLAARLRVDGSDGAALGRDDGSADQGAQGHAGWVNQLAFSGDGRRIVSASHDQTLRLWDAADGEVDRGAARTRRVHLGRGHSADGTLIASASEDRTVRLWDAGSSSATPSPADMSKTSTTSLSARTALTSPRPLGTTRSGSGM